MDFPIGTFEMPRPIRITKQSGEVLNREAFDRSISGALSLLSNGEYTLTIKRIVKPRTLSQNALFHVWVAVIAKEVGYTSVEDCKRDVKRHILGQKDVLNRITKQAETADFQTSQMTTAELADFMDRMRIWAHTDLGCELPYIGDAGYEEMMQEYSKQ